jgi:hypothetical protein
LHFITERVDRLVSDRLLLFVVAVILRVVAGLTDEPTAVAAPPAASAAWLAPAGDRDDVAQHAWSVADADDDDDDNDDHAVLADEPDLPRAPQPDQLPAVAPPLALHTGTDPPALFRPPRSVEA